MSGGYVLQENILLAPFTTFKTGGPARYFAAVSTIGQLQAAITDNLARKVPILILAGGSNLIISRNGFAGLVLHLDLNWYQLDQERLTAGASAPMATLVNVSIDASLQGLEWAGGLPGTFGGAIRGNAGAFGGEMKDIVIAVRSLNLTTGRETILTNAECQFGYRDSLFKHQPELIVEATLKLRPGDHTALRASADDHICYRQEKHPLELPNSGSIFKNIPVTTIAPDVLTHFNDSIKTDPLPVVPAAKVIAEAGAQGLQVGQAQVSLKHTNYIVNLGGATGEEIRQLIQKVQAIVDKKYGIRLEVEPELVGFEA